MENEETLQTGALVRKLANTVQHKIYDLFADRVMTASVIVRSILFTSDQLFRVEKLAISSSANLVYKL